MRLFGKGRGKHGHKHHGGHKMPGGKFARHPENKEKMQGQDDGDSSTPRGRGGVVQLDASQCVGCGKCIGVCKSGALSMSA